MTRLWHAPDPSYDDSVGLSRAGYIASPVPVERDLRRLFNIDSVRVVFDIGACEGEDSVRYARLFPKAVVYAAEPLPRNLSRLRATAASLGEERIRVLPVALSDRVGTAAFHVSSGQPDGRPEGEDWDFGNKSSSLLAPDRHRSLHPWVHFDEVIEVTTDTLASVCQREGIATIDLVHLDVQGAELAVLEGAGPVLARVKAVWMEVEAVPLYADQPLKPDVERYMSRHGFRRLKDTVGAISGDQFYLNEELVKIPFRLRVWYSSPAVIASRFSHRLVARLRRTHLGRVNPKDSR